MVEILARSLSLDVTTVTEEMTAPLRNESESRAVLGEYRAHAKI